MAFVIQAERNADELKLRRAEVASMESQIEIYKSTIAKYEEQESLLNGKVTSLETTIANLEDALERSQSNVGLTEQQRQLFSQRLDEYRAELAETQKDLDRCKSSRKWYLLGGAAGGFVLGKGNFNF